MPRSKASSSNGNTSYATLDSSRAQTSNRRKAPKTQSSVSSSASTAVAGRRSNRPGKSRKKKTKHEVRVDVGNHFPSDEILGIPTPVLQQKRVPPTSTKKNRSRRHFCSSFGLAYMANSYFAKRLALVTFLIVALDSAGLFLFYYGYFDLFDTFYSNTEVVDDDTNAGCVNTIRFSLLVYHAAAINAVLGLPSSGFRIFDMFGRRVSTKHRSHNSHQRADKIKRTLFLQFCEVLVVLTILYLFVLTLYGLYTLVVDPFQCEALTTWGFAAAATIVYFLTFVQVTFFARFREHLKNQLGVFKEKDQTGGGGRIGNGGPSKAGGDKSVTIKLITADLRKRMYTSVEAQDRNELEGVLSEASHLLGEDFVDEMYGSAELMCFGFLSSKSKKNPMHLAAYKGDIESLELLHKHGFNVNATDKVFRVRFNSGDLFWYFLQYLVRRQIADTENISLLNTTLLTPLHCAVAAGRVDTVQWLISHGANVNERAKSTNRSDRLPPIFMAEHPQIAEYLLQAGANHLIVPDPGYMNTITALDLAYHRENYSVATVLEDWGGDVALTPLHAAAATDNVVEVLRFLKGGANPDCLGEHEYEGINRRTPLHWAATTGCRRTVKALLKYNANPNFQDASGKTPVFFAARHNEAEIVCMLLEWGANANDIDANDVTPIIFASSGNNVSKDVFAPLIAAGGDINYQLPNGDTAMHVAMKNENRETALSLLGCGADITICNRDGFRPVDCTTSTALQFIVKKAAGNRDVMISYTHSHAEIAEKLRESLERSNVTTWIDKMEPSGIGGGTVWRDEIASGILNASCVLCILTQDYPKSEWCLKELAYAKQTGTPVIGISCENVEITEELQVYLYTRQIVPFESAIVSISDSNPKNVTYRYDDLIYESQFRCLLDGVRDEIEKRRQAGLAFENPKSNLKNQILLHSAPERASSFVFLSHGKCHINFVRTIYQSLVAKNVAVYVDNVGWAEEDVTDLASQLNRAKDAILKCECFLVVLSDKTATNEVVNDQLAFAEDKKKPIMPLLLSDPSLTLGQQYTLSRNEIYHFVTEQIGFGPSFNRLIRGVYSHSKNSARGSLYIPKNSDLLGSFRSTRTLSRNNNNTSNNGYESPAAFSYAKFI